MKKITPEHSAMPENIEDNNSSESGRLQPRRPSVLTAYHDIAAAVFSLGRTVDVDDLFLSAARDGDLEKMQNFLQRRDAIINVDIKDKRTGNTPLMWAAKRGHSKIVHLLLKYGADTTLRNYECKTAIQVASPVIKNIILHSVERSGSSHRHLLQAAWQGNIDIIRQVLNSSRSLDINCRNADGLTPLLLVTRDADMFERLSHQQKSRSTYDPVAVVHELLKYRADIDAIDNERKTALHYASSSKSTVSNSLVKVLLRDGSKTEARDRRCFTPIHCASEIGNADIVQSLIDGGSDVNARGLAGATPLHITAYKGHEKLAVTLLSNGADVTIVNDSGLTAAHVAKSKKMKETLKEAWVDATQHKVEKALLNPVRPPTREGSRLSIDEIRLEGTPRTPRLPFHRQLTNTEKALLAEDKMVKDIESGRYNTPTPTIEPGRKQIPLRTFPGAKSDSSPRPSEMAGKMPDELLSPLFRRTKSQRTSSRKSNDDKPGSGRRSTLPDINLRSSVTSITDEERSPPYNMKEASTVSMVLDNEESDCGQSRGGQTTPFLQKRRRHASDELLSPSLNDLASSCDEFLFKGRSSTKTYLEDIEDVFSPPPRLTPIRTPVPSANDRARLRNLHTIKETGDESLKLDLSALQTSIEDGNPGQHNFRLPTQTFITQLGLSEIVQGSNIDVSKEEELGPDGVKLACNNVIELVRGKSILKTEFNIEESRKAVKPDDSSPHSSNNYSSCVSTLSTPSPPPDKNENIIDPAISSQKTIPGGKLVSNSYHTSKIDKFDDRRGQNLSASSSSVSSGSTVKTLENHSDHDTTIVLLNRSPKETSSNSPKGKKTSPKERLSLAAETTAKLKAVAKDNAVQAQNRKTDDSSIHVQTSESENNLCKTKSPVGIQQIPQQTIVASSVDTSRQLSNAPSTVGSGIDSNVVNFDKNGAKTKPTFSLENVQKLSNVNRIGSITSQLKPKCVSPLEEEKVVDADKSPSKNRESVVPNSVVKKPGVILKNTYSNSTTSTAAKNNASQSAGSAVSNKIETEAKKSVTVGNVVRTNLTKISYNNSASAIPKADVSEKDSEALRSKSGIAVRTNNTGSSVAPVPSRQSANNSSQQKGIVVNQNALNRSNNANVNVQNQTANNSSNAIQKTMNRANTQMTQNVVTSPNIENNEVVHKSSITHVAVQGSSTTSGEGPISRLQQLKSVANRKLSKSEDESNIENNSNRNHAATAIAAKNTSKSVAQGLEKAIAQTSSKQSTKVIRQPLTDEKVTDKIKLGFSGLKALFTDNPKNEVVGLYETVTSPEEVATQQTPLVCEMFAEVQPPLQRDDLPNNGPPVKRTNSVVSKPGNKSAVGSRNVPNSAKSKPAGQKTSTSVNKKTVTTVTRKKTTADVKVFTTTTKVATQPKSGLKTNSGTKAKKNSASNKKKGKKNKDILNLNLGGRDPTKTAFISGIGWHVATDCNENPDVAAVQILPDSSDEESEEEIPEEIDVAPPVLNLRGSFSQFPCTGEDQPEVLIPLPQQKLGCSQVVARVPSPFENFCKAFDELTEMVREEVRLQTPSPRTPTVIPQTVKVIQDFSSKKQHNLQNCEAVNDDNINEIIEEILTINSDAGVLNDSLTNSMRKKIQKQTSIESQGQVFTSDSGTLTPSNSYNTIPEAMNRFHADNLVEMRKKIKTATRRDTADSVEHEETSKDINILPVNNENFDFKNILDEDHVRKKPPTGKQKTVNQANVADQKGKTPRGGYYQEVKIPCEESDTDDDFNQSQKSLQFSLKTSFKEMLQYPVDGVPQGEVTREVINSTDSHTSHVGLRSRHSSRPSSAMSERSNAHDGEEVNDWRKGNMLGRGAYGTVWLGLLNNSGGFMAVKQIELNTHDKRKAEQEYEKIKDELELLKTLKHRNIVEYYGTCLEDNMVKIFMEFIPGGSIANLLGSFGALEEAVFCIYTKQILEGVRYIHSKGVIHRDIKGGNVMLTQDGVIKLIDFGCAKRLSLNHSVGNQQMLKSMRGTPYWMAPEVVMETGHGQKSDIWSVGCTVFEMATRKPPWADMTPMAAIFAIGSEKPVPKLPDKLSADACSFVEKCLTRDQDNRPSASQLLSHPFISRQFKKHYRSNSFAQLGKN